MLDVYKGKWDVGKGTGSPEHLSSSNSANNYNCHQVSAYYRQGTKLVLPQMELYIIRT